MLTRLLEHVADLVLPESQCGFRRGCSKIDMIFVARQLQEKCCEQHEVLYMAFVDLTQSIETFFGTFCANLTALALLLPYYNNFIPVRVLKLSLLVLCQSSFPVSVGVKQGCVLARIIINLLLITMTLASHRDLQSSDCVGIENRLDGGLFNLQRLQAKTKTSSQ